MISRVQRLFLPAIILGLVALAAFGVRQVIVGQEDPTSPILPGEALRIRATIETRSRQEVSDFVAEAGDPCSLPLLEGLISLSAAYGDLDSLVRNVDLIVVGRPSNNAVEAPPPAATGARVLTTLELDETIMGTVSTNSISIDSGQRVGLEGSRLARIGIGDPDFCKPGQVLLLLKAPAAPGAYTYASQGWVRIEGASLVPAPFTGAFDGYATADALLDAVRIIAQRQSE